MTELLVVTYCSALKDERPGDLPAVERYLSPRIRAVYQATELAGVSFRILSGRYGLLEASTAIPYYDHLLTMKEVEGHSGRIAEQLEAIRPRRVLLFSLTLNSDPNVGPYRSVLELACQKQGIGFEMLELVDDEFTAQDVAAMIQRSRDI